MEVRRPNKSDGRAIFELASACAPPLDLNSMYLYFLIGAHFDETSAVVEAEGEVVGFTSAYIIPKQRDHLFIWQVAVDEAHRSKGLARSMLDEILARESCKDVRYMDATITSSNESSKRLFKAMARERGAECSEQSFLESEHFGDEDHEQEILFTIGPFT